LTTPEAGDPGGALMTDLYHVDAAYVAWRTGQNAPTTFDLYTRSLPFGSAFLLTAGLDAAVAFARGFRYTEADLACLGEMKTYDPAFLRELADLRFTGEILAMPEGSVAFAHEPLLRVTAPFREALLLESGLLHAIGRATLIATKAARVVQAARGRPVTEFALRRAAEPLTVARSAAIGGCAATSFVGAARALGLPTAGTIPHALVQAFPSEEAAFRAVAAALDRYTLLLDTYDARRSIRTAAAVAREEHARSGHRLAAVRLDSGDLAAESRFVRRVLDEAGLGDAKVLASGDLDEYRIDELVRAGAPLDGFGVGTSLGVGLGSVERGIGGCALGVVYKLVRYGAGPEAGAARIKLAGAKSTWPGAKQVYRVGSYERDVIQLQDERPPADAVPLLRPVVRDGETVAGALPPLSETRRRASEELATLPERYRRLDAPEAYPVEWSAGLRELRRVASEGPWQGGPDRG
jgi:nicotinate phosphoribosyltransferase